MSITNTKSLFKEMNISKDILTANQKKQLDKQGYIVFKSIPFMKKNVKKMRDITKKLISKEGDKGGWEGKEKYYVKGKLFEKGTNRLGNLINKSKVFGELMLIPEILSSAYTVINSNLKVAGLNFRNPLKNSGKQRLHMDWKPRKKMNEKFAGVVCFIFLDDANKKIENLINKAYSENISKLIVITGKGLHSKNEKDPYVSKDLSILKYSVPEFIKSNSELMKIIKKIEDNTDNKNSGFFTLFLKIKE